MNNKYNNINEIVKQKIKETAEKKEEILTAFVAKYGIEPNKIVEIYQGNSWYLVDIDNTDLCNSGKCYELKNKLYYEISKYKQKEIKNNECDHIVAMHHHYDCLIHLSEIKSDYYDKASELIQKFNFCPECGEKLDEK